jgi:hypothetical protein
MRANIAYKNILTPFNLFYSYKFILSMQVWLLYNKSIIVL